MEHEKNSRGPQIGFFRGWVLVLDVPPFLKLRFLILSLANLCRGLSETEEIMDEEVSMEEVKFKAKGNADGFIPLLGYLKGT